MRTGICSHIIKVNKAPVWVAIFVAATALTAMAAERAVRLPPGFRISVFASGLSAPRFMAFDEKGNLLVSLPGRGQVVALPDDDGNGRADRKIVFASGLNNPHGLAFRGEYLYVAEEGRVVRFTDRDGDLKGDKMKVVVPELPSGGGHWTRTLGFGPQGKMYVSVGSSCNVCLETDPRRGAIMVFDSDGGNGRIFARGLRNSVGLVWDGRTGRMWATENGRDWLGDDLPPDELNLIKGGAHYGWPRCYGDGVPDPEYGDAEFCRHTEPAALKFQAHSAPLGLAFYTGDLFPRRYRGDLFVAFHGSWNRSVPTGYKVVRVRMKRGRPVGVEDFATGWLSGRRVWGRPVDLVVDPEGRLLVSDDWSGRIYIISYER